MSVSNKSKTTNFFPEYGSNYSFSHFEEQILAFWKEQKIFSKTLDPKKYKKQFSFYDGPPFATGLPHYGHLLAGTIKDIVPRYWAMRGHRIERRFGWDCHGLPIEFEMEKKLNLNGSLAIKDYGVDKFNEACRGIVQRYSTEWKTTVEKMGRWVDMENDYKTMDPSFMESVWWVFKQLWEKGLIYEGKKVVPYSWRLTAPLSNFEASLNYKSVQDPAVTVALPIVNFKKHPDWQGNTALAIWTTTPWTLPSNLAVAVHPNSKKVAYGRFKLDKAMGAVTHLIVGKEAAKKFHFTNLENEVDNDELVGVNYKPMFSLFDDEQRKKENAFRVIAADFVSAEDGTALVHEAPAFGEVDFYACQKEKISLVDPTDMQAQFTNSVSGDPDLAEVEGVFVKDADKIIIKKLKENGLLIKQDVIQHNYPFCERSETPLIYKAIPSWFVNVEKIKDEIVTNAKEIEWVPDYIKEGRFGKWLANARDWCISRNRFWGTPIPVWINDESGEVKVIGSIAELEEFSGEKVTDLHSHFVDKIQPKGKDGGTFVRTTEVLDCWFESGSMPYAQKHYPFENSDSFEGQFPADFIAEGLDQTRCWFYNLMVLSTALFDKPAFKNVIVNGIVLAEDGKKMSKRLRNYPDPLELIGEYGADAIRLYLMQSPAMRAEEVRFSKQGMIQIMRAVMLPLWNAYSFFASYANIDEWKPEQLADADSDKLIDRWIIARVKEIEIDIHASMKNYKLYEVAPRLIEFIDDLTNWYIRLNRDRFWTEFNKETEQDKIFAYSTLYSVLSKLSTLMAPGLPFLAENLNAALCGIDLDSLKNSSQYQSVHEKIYADPDTLKLSASEVDLIDEIDVAKKLILLGRALRGEAKIGLRQPLSKMRVAGLSKSQVEKLSVVRELILGEVNIKELELVEKASDLVDEKVKPNFKTLGPKAGKNIKTIQQELSAWGEEQIKSFETQGSVEIAGVNLGSDDVEIVRKAKQGRFALADYGFVAELDTDLNDELVKEGVQREIVNRIQQKRKELDFHLADRIEVSWHASPNSLVESVLLEESSALGLIASETLAEKFSRKDSVTPEIELGDNGAFSFELQKR